MKTHGMSGTREYNTWRDILKRCLKPNHKDYPNYGGRGIKICDSWLKFENFYSDMGDKPEGHSIDRVNNNLGYNKDNCRWATRKEQNRNKRDSLIYKGENSTEASKRLGGSKDMVQQRITILGWSKEKAFNTKIL